MRCRLKNMFFFAEQPFSKIFSVVPKVLELLACSCKKCKCDECSSKNYDGNDDIDNICDYRDDEYSDDNEVKDDDVDENNDDQ